jgi:hypothetical protein
MRSVKNETVSGRRGESKEEGEGRYKRKIIKRRKQFPNASKIEELQEERGNKMSDIRKKL